MPIDPASYWTKVSAVEEGPLGCWPWLGALGRPDGRALLHDPDRGRPTQAARIAWQLSHHPVPDGLQVLHLCDHPWCVRLTHLVVSSQAANVADRLRKQWVQVSSRPRHPEPPQHDPYQTATQVRPATETRRRRPAAGSLLTRTAAATALRRPPSSAGLPAQPRLPTSVWAYAWEMARRADEHTDDPVVVDGDDVTPEAFTTWLDQLQVGEPLRLGVTAAETLAEARAAGEV